MRTSAATDSKHERDSSGTLGSSYNTRRVTHKQVVGAATKTAAAGVGAVHLGPSVTCPAMELSTQHHAQNNIHLHCWLCLLSGASPELVNNDFRRQYGLDLLQETAAGHQDAAAGQPVTSADGPSAMAHGTDGSCKSTTVLSAGTGSNSNSVDSTKPGVEPISPAPSSNRGTQAEPAAGTGSRKDPYPASSSRSVSNDEKAGDARRCHFVEVRFP